MFAMHAQKIYAGKCNLQELVPDSALLQLAFRDIQKHVHSSIFCIGATIPLGKICKLVSNHEVSL